MSMQESDKIFQNHVEVHQYSVPCGPMPKDRTKDIHVTANRIILCSVLEIIVTHYTGIKENFKTLLT